MPLHIHMRARARAYTHMHTKHWSFTTVKYVVASINQALTPTRALLYAHPASTTPPHLHWVCIPIHCVLLILLHSLCFSLPSIGSYPIEKGKAGPFTRNLPGSSGQCDVSCSFVGFLTFLFQTGPCGFANSVTDSNWTDVASLHWHLLAGCLLDNLQACKTLPWRRWLAVPPVSLSDAVLTQMKKN